MRERARQLARAWQPHESQATLRARRERYQELRAALSHFPDDYGESPHERALVYGLKADTPDCVEWCDWCADLAHRRAQPTCHGCSKPYAAEVVALKAPEMQSSLFGAERFGW